MFYKAELSWFKRTERSILIEIGFKNKKYGLQLEN